MSEKDGASQMSEPVAMVCVRDHFKPEGHGRFVSWLKNPHDIPEHTYLYASSYAQGVADAAKVCERMTEKWIRRHSPGAMGQMCGLGEGTASECLDAIRALSAPPSVTEDWAWKVATCDGEISRDESHDEYNAVRATLAALGIEVTK